MPIFITSCVTANFCSDTYFLAPCHCLLPSSLPPSPLPILLLSPFPSTFSPSLPHSLISYPPLPRLIYALPATHPLYIPLLFSSVLHNLEHPLPSSLLLPSLRLFLSLPFSAAPPLHMPPAAPFTENLTRPLPSPLPSLLLRSKIKPH